MTMGLSTGLASNCMDDYLLFSCYLEKQDPPPSYASMAGRTHWTGEQVMESSACATNLINLVCKWRSGSPVKTGCGSSA